ncbi:hypothetical protein ACBR40_43305 [Nonomuraea sp. AD125B]|uniref:hypothetical protein n=1 Tax=Nonomuraea sp. AD125B TaxID=3242897 RepID=UPI0035279D27
MNELTRLARVRDEELTGQSSTEGARALLAAITAGQVEPAPARRARRLGTPARRLLAGAAATAVLAAGAVLGPGLLAGPGGTAVYASTELDITREGGEWVARVKDAYAQYDAYTRGFAAVGLDVHLQIVPAGPSRAGGVVQMGVASAGGATRGSTAMRTDSEPSGCVVGRAGCVLVIRLPVTFEGRAWVKLGRSARPGEAYEAPGRADAKGEPLEGVAIGGRTVGEVSAAARARGLEVVYQLITPRPHGGFSARPGEEASGVGPGWYVWDAESIRDGAVRLLVTKEHLARNPVRGDAFPTE